MARTSETWKVAMDGNALSTEIHMKMQVSHRWPGDPVPGAASPRPLRDDQPVD